MNDIIEAEEVVAARGVKVVFGAVKALDGADLSIRAGNASGSSAITARENPPSSTLSMAG